METDIAVHQDQIDTLSSQATQFISGGHFDAATIQQKQKALVLRYEGLKVIAFISSSNLIYFPRTHYTLKRNVLKHHVNFSSFFETLTMKKLG